MVISSIVLKRFRNYINENIIFNKGINIIRGQNAQGKTNIVEAVMICCMGRSPKTIKDKELINFDYDAGYVKVLSKCNIGNTEVELYITKNEKKRIKINGIPINKMGELMGCIRGIYFSPDELKLIKEAPEDRRRFLDIDLSQLKKRYFYTLKRYSKILQQRNNLLKKSTPSELMKTLEIWDRQLAKEGAYLIYERGEFCQKLGGYLTQTHNYLTESAENIKISYACKIEFIGKTIEEIEQQLFDKLQSNIQKDIDLRYTTTGPHRDDIKITINDIDIRTYGSQGQQRTAALSMKLSELELFKKESGEYPILVLDDVLSELDKNRQKRLIEFCQKCQTLLTTTHIDNGIIDGFDYNIIDIENGKVIKK